MDLLERKLRDTLAIYGHQVIERNRIPENAAGIIKHTAIVSMLSGMACAASLLTQNDGCDCITAQNILKAADTIAKDLGATTEQYTHPLPPSRRGSHLHRNRPQRDRPRRPRGLRI